jgi:hypothetical protein
MGNINIVDYFLTKAKNKLHLNKSNFVYNFIVNCFILMIPLFVFFSYYFELISVFNIPALFILSFLLSVLLKYKFKNNNFLIKCLKIESSVLFLFGCFISTTIILYSHLHIQLMSSYMFFIYFLIIMFFTKQISFNITKKIFCFFYFFVLANTLTFIYVGSISLIFSTLFIYLLGDDKNNKKQMGFTIKEFNLFLIFMSFISIFMFYSEKYIHFIGVFSVDLLIYVFLLLSLLFLFYLEEFHKNKVGIVIMTSYMVLSSYSVYISLIPYL